MKTRPEEFKKFVRLLGKNAPSNYTPHFFRLEKNSKAPKLEYGSWKNQRQRITPKKSLWWLKHEGNVGIAGMPNDPLVNVDIDDSEKTKKTDLKPTLIARSRSRTGIHAWYFSESNIPNIPTDNAGEVRSQGQYVVAPGSFVPYEEDIEDAGYYTIEEKNPVSWIEIEGLPKVFLEEKEEREQEEEREKRNFDPKKTDGDHSAVFDVEAGDVVEFEGGETRPSARWTAIFHASSTDMNMSFSKNGLLHCWRHEVSLNGLQALTVLSGYMSCMDAGSPHKPHKKYSAGPSKVINNDAALFHAWRYAKENGYIPEDDPCPTRALEHIAREHDVCDPDDCEILPKWAYNQVLDIIEEEY